MIGYLSRFDWRRGRDCQPVAVLHASMKLLTLGVTTMSDCDGISTQSALSKVRGSLLRDQDEVSQLSSCCATGATHAIRIIRSRLSALFILNSPGAVSSNVEPVEK